MKPINVVAKDLRTPLYRKRVIVSKKFYKRQKTVDITRDR